LPLVAFVITRLGVFNVIISLPKQVRQQKPA
jgi:hypothetical protein